MGGVKTPLFFIFMYMEHIIRKYLLEHESQSNFDKVVNRLGQDIDSEILDKIKNYVKSFIQDGGYTVKFLNSCSAGFLGVRTKKQVIICSPNSMSFGDFIYTIFHELRHEEQMGVLKMKNPLVDMDLDDFENLSEKYWNLEMDADNEAKKNVAKMVLNLNISEELSKKYFKLSQYIENYQMASNMVKFQLKGLVADIIRMKKEGLEYTDIQDHPIVKRHLDKLEDFI
jgi:hypothetical protein